LLCGIPNRAFSQLIPHSQNMLQLTFHKSSSL
jgi:hypothetical protein